MHARPGITPALVPAVASRFLAACLTCQFLIRDLDRAELAGHQGAPQPIKATQPFLPFPCLECGGGADFPLILLPGVVIPRDVLNQTFCRMLGRWRNAEAAAGVTSSSSFSSLSSSRLLQSPEWLSLPPLREVNCILVEHRFLSHVLHFLLLSYPLRVGNLLPHELGSWK